MIYEYRTDRQPKMMYFLKIVTLACAPVYDGSPTHIYRNTSGTNAYALVVLSTYSMQQTTCFVFVIEKSYGKRKPFQRLQRHVFCNVASRTISHIDGHSILINCAWFGFGSSRILV